MSLISICEFFLQVVWRSNILIYFDWKNNVLIYLRYWAKVDRGALHDWILYKLVDVVFFVFENFLDEIFVKRRRFHRLNKIFELLISRDFFQNFIKPIFVIIVLKELVSVSKLLLIILKRFVRNNFGVLAAEISCDLFGYFTQEFFCELINIILELVEA